MVKVHRVSDRYIWRKAYKQLYKKIIDLNSSHQKALLLLSGGSAKNLYQIMADDIKHNLLRLNLYSFAQIDERFQPESNNEINAKQIEKTGLSQVLREKNIPFFTISQQDSLKTASGQYNQTIAGLFRQLKYRIAILGIGDDCHTAGLLPGYQKFWDVDGYVVGYQNKGRYPQRISVTPKTLRQIDYTIIVTAGNNKEKALENALKVSKENNRDRYPAGIVQEMSEVEIFTN